MGVLVGGWPMADGCRIKRRITAASRRQRLCLGMVQ